MRLLLAIPLVLLASGCLTTISNEPRYVLAGAFTREASQADFDDFGALVRNETGREVALMKSLPAQFRIDDLENAQCTSLHDALRDKAYLTRLDTCRPEGAPEPVEQTTSWSLHGAFTENATQTDYDEVGALVEEHTGQREFAIMESFPPQFRVADMTRPQCDALRGALEGKPYLRSLDECRELTKTVNP